MFSWCVEVKSLDASVPALTSTNVEGPYSASNRAKEAETKSDTLILLPLGGEVGFWDAGGTTSPFIASILCYRCQLSAVMFFVM